MRERECVQTCLTASVFHFRGGSCLNYLCVSERLSERALRVDTYLFQGRILSEFYGAMSPRMVGAFPDGPGSGRLLGTFV